MEKLINGLMALPKFQGASERRRLEIDFRLQFFPSDATLRDFSARRNVKLFRFPSVRVFGKASRENELTGELVPMRKSRLEQSHDDDSSDET